MIAEIRTREAIGRDAAFEQGVDLVYDELQQIGVGGDFALCRQGLGALVHRRAPARFQLRCL